MKRLALAAAVLGASCASAPPKVERQLLGTWSCEAPVNGGTLKGPVTYAAGGKSTFKLNFSGEVAGQPVEAAGDGDGTWKLLEKDSKLESTLGNVSFTSVKAGGRDVPPALAQALLAPMLTKDSEVSTIKLEKDSLTLTSSGGSATTCSR